MASSRRSARTGATSRASRMPDGGAAGVPIDPGPPPRLGDPATDQAFKDQAVEVIRDSSLLDPTDGATIDISPGARGGNSLGTNDGHGAPGQPGHRPAVSAATSSTWATSRGSWPSSGRTARSPRRRPATGTCSPTWSPTSSPPTCGSPAPVRPSTGSSGTSSCTWRSTARSTTPRSRRGVSRATTTATRPISMIRYMGGLGQSSDPNGPSYNKEGLPLVPGLIEVVTKATTAPGQRHAALAGHEGEIAVRAWAGNPKDPKTADRRGRPGSSPPTGSPTSCRRS